jgi:hypothetical protein
VIINDLVNVYIRDFEASPTNVRFARDTVIVTKEVGSVNVMLMNTPLTPEDIARIVWNRIGRTLTA